MFNVETLSLIRPRASMCAFDSMCARGAVVGALLATITGCGPQGVVEGPALGDQPSIGAAPPGPISEANGTGASNAAEEDASGGDPFVQTADGSSVETPPAPTGVEAPPGAGTQTPIDVGYDAAFSDDAAQGGGAEDTSGWTLTWSDEFDGPDGSPPDPSKWNVEVSGTGGGNKELEYYTPQNAVVQGGNLVITATTEGASQYSCWYGQCQYTSARLNTQGNFSQQYGRFEARILSPSGQGMWPAFWTLGVSGGWPACGEMDIMESINLVTANHGSLHAPNYNPTATYEPTPGLNVAFHTYAVEWDQSSITFFVDDTAYETHTPSDAAKSGGTWAFNQPFYVLINLAIGGNWPGNPDSSTTFPQTMVIDWVRVYTKNGAN